MRSSAPRSAIAGALALLVAGCAQAQKRPAGPPTGVAAYSRHSRFVEAKISPKGTYLAAISLEDGRRSLAFVNLATRKLASRLKPAQGTMIGDFHWVSDERVVANLVDQDGDLATPKARGEIYAVSARDGTGHLVYGWRAGREVKSAYLKNSASTYGWGRVLDTVRVDERRFLVEAFTPGEVGDNARARVVELDAYSGFARDVTTSPIPGASILTDEAGLPRVASGRDAERRRRTYVRDAEGWRELAIGEATPRAFSTKDHVLYVADGASGGFGLYAVPLAGGARRLVARNDLVPPSRTLNDPDTGRVLAVEFQPDVPTWEFVEPDHPLCRVLKGLLAAHPDEHVAIVDATADQKKVIARVYADRDPGEFLLVDVATMTAEPVAEARPWIRPQEQAATTAFHVQASDGVRIHGYLTLPRATPGAAPPPLVVHPHGGPHGHRDRWGFDPTVQFLASEGFAVLQVNYRGSGGYGDAFEEAGFRHWGDRMIEDIVDATRWAMKKGYADPKRACTFGASYGGYAALQAAVIAPDLFRCAIGYAGVYDLTRLPGHDEWVTSSIMRGHFRAVLGDDLDALARMSPVNHAGEIKARVLLIHGGEDWRAEIQHAKLMRAALERAGNPPQWLYEPIEGHGFYDEGARERMFERVLAFLRENTGAAAPK